MGPSVQIEIETLAEPAPGGTVTGGVKLEPVEDTALLRAVGTSVRDPARSASYTGHDLRLREAWLTSLLAVSMVRRHLRREFAEADCPKQT